MMTTVFFWFVFMTSGKSEMGPIYATPVLMIAGFFGGSYVKVEILNLIPVWPNYVKFW